MVKLLARKSASRNRGRTRDDASRRTLEAVARTVRAVGDRERVMAGTDCGFGTIVGDTQVPEGVVWAKLEAMRDGAAIAGKRLWSRTLSPDPNHESPSPPPPQSERRRLADGPTRDNGSA